MGKNVYLNTVRLITTVLLCCALGQAAWAEEKTDITSSIFGGKGGYFHPYISVAGVYDDNVYRTEENETGDYAAVVSPGIWFAVPGTRKKVVNLTTSTLATGGLNMVREREPEFKRFQGYLHYGADLTRYVSETENDTDDQRLDGYFQYNFRGGLSLALLDIYQNGHEGWADGVSRDLDEFKSNLIGGRASYDISSKFMLQGDYKYFVVDYDALSNQKRNRDDQFYSAYLFYKYSTKTSLFTQYDFVDINYENGELLQSQEHHLYGGIRWQVTGKTTGEAKAGYLTKEYENPLADTGHDFVMQAWANYQLTGKGSIKLAIARISEEPDIYSAEGVLSNRVDLTYLHKLNGKMRLRGQLGYGLKSYDGLTVTDTFTGEREDDEYKAGVGYEYWVQRWLNIRADYQFYKLDSNVPDFSYSDNKVLLRVSLTM